jgi:hypothetical protein
MPAFDYTSGNPDNLVGGLPAKMQDIQGPFYDLRAYLNTLTPGGGGGGGGAGLVVSSPVSDVGQVNQCRAGRQLTPSDFTNLGLSAPRGLWNLSDLTDASGSARTLTNKGGIGFATGINGAVTTAAQFAGSTGQALYIADTGAADPFRITTGSWGCWFRTAKRGVSQFLLAKLPPGAGATDAWFTLAVGSTNVATVGVGAQGATGATDVADDRWHFAVAVNDGSVLRLYVDGVLESASLYSAAPVAGVAGPPLNVGGYGADGATGAVSPHFGRVDEAFVTADVLSEDQVRVLYAARLVHTLGAQPKTVSLNVRRQRRGAALATTDFSTQPVRLYNFTAGSLNDQGSNATPVVNNGGAVSVAGTDGTLGNGLSFAGAQTLSATDAGLPSALLARTYGCWFKSSNATAASDGILTWGTYGTADARLRTASGNLGCNNGGDAIAGPFVADGQWHSGVVVEDNTAADGVKRKLYLDGRLVGGSTVMNTLTLAGANRFRVGAQPDGTLPFIGQIDRVFVCAYAMTQEEVTRIYNKATQPMASSPKNAGDHVEGFDSGSLLVVADTLDAQHYIDLTVS